MDRADKLSMIQREALGLFKKKNTDYGDAFATYGSVGVLVRIGDKLARHTSISSSGVSLIESEKLRDTLIDLHNYAAMAVMLLDETNEPVKTAGVEENTEEKEVEPDCIHDNVTGFDDREILDFLKKHEEEEANHAYEVTIASLRDEANDSMTMKEGGNRVGIVRDRETAKKAGTKAKLFFLLKNKELYEKTMGTQAFELYFKTLV